MKILFGVSDWGLGHATRDIPLINTLLKKGHKVDIIATGRALKLLKAELGNKCIFFDIPGMVAPYSKGLRVIPNFVINVPKMYRALKRARKKVIKILSENHYDRVISDCRFEVYDKKENSFLINHQLWIRRPFYTFPVGVILMNIANKKFGCVIVPDFKGRQLTRVFSSKHFYDVPVKYIGILSYLKKKKLKQDIDYFVTVSGPEPQRTIFEEKILSQIEHLKGNVVIGLGKPEDNSIIKKNNVTIYGFLNSKQQEEMMNRAKFIISRPGYTTVMDIIELDKKKAFFIPTPGQPEQEYLANLYERKHLFPHAHQSSFDLSNMEKEAKMFVQFKSPLKINSSRILLEFKSPLKIKTYRGFSGFKAPWKTKTSIKKFLNIIEK